VGPSRDDATFPCHVANHFLSKLTLEAKFHGLAMMIVLLGRLWQQDFVCDEGEMHTSYCGCATGLREKEESVGDGHNGQRAY
jgi:hypothetical protein